MSDIVLDKLCGYDRTIECPPDKSISVRAVIFCSYAVGSSVVKNLSLCGDVESTVECMRRLGADIRLEGNTAYITGRPFRSASLDCGNSATAARLLTGLLTGLNGVFTIDGDRSLRSRDMSELLTYLRSMGACITDCDGKLPLRIEGRALGGGVFKDVASAQVKSGLLLAGLNADSEVTVEQRFALRDHSETMLRNMNGNVSVEGNRVTVSPSVLYACDVTVPGDISAAAYPIGLALSVPGGRCTVKNVGLNATRTAFLDILKEAGAKIRITARGSAGGEPTGDVSVEYGRLRPIIVDGQAAAQAIDEIPLLCAAACFIDGISYIDGAGALRNKETDRIKTMVAALSALGADIDGTENGFIINGRKKLVCGTVDPCGDHRIAMAAAVAGAAGGGAVIKDSECVAVSYPDFFAEVIGV